MEAVADRASPTIERAPEETTRRKKQPAYHVVLLDDDDHTYEYVIGMLRKLFGYSTETAFQLASEVDETGRVIVDTTTLERAELKRDQIKSFGRDWRIPRCAGSMSVVIEPAR
jgi:ATP-dependent Clp protease adaptor protein ClpS